MDKYIANVAGTLTEKAALASSAGAGDSGKIPGLDGAGRLDATFMPVGTDIEIQNLVATEALNAGDFVNVWTSTGAKVRKADASTSGKKADGFVLAAVSNGGTAAVYLAGINTSVTSVTAGAEVYLSDTTPGGFVTTAPAGTGKTVQKIGVGLSTTAIDFKPVTVVVLA